MKGAEIMPCSRGAAQDDIGLKRVGRVQRPERRRTRAGAAVAEDRAFGGLDSHRKAFDVLVGNMAGTHGNRREAQAGFGRSVPHLSNSGLTSLFVVGPSDDDGPKSKPTRLAEVLGSDLRADGECRRDRPDVQGSTVLVDKRSSPLAATASAPLRVLDVAAQR